VAIEVDEAALDAIGANLEDPITLKAADIARERLIALVVSQLGNGRGRVLSDGSKLLITSDTVAAEKTQGRRGPDLPGQWTLVGLSAPYEKRPGWSGARPRPASMLKLLDPFPIRVFGDEPLNARDVLLFYHYRSLVNILVDAASLRQLGLDLNQQKINHSLGHAPLRQHLSLWAASLNEETPHDAPPLKVGLDAWGSFIIATEDRLRLLCGFGEDHDQASGPYYAERLLWLQSASFDGASLDWSLKTVERWTGLQVVADWDDLAAHGITPEMRLEFVLHPLVRPDDFEDELLIRVGKMTDAQRIAGFSQIPAGRLIHLLAATLGDGSALFVLDGDTLRLTTPQHAARLLSLSTGDARALALPHWGVETQPPWEPDDEDHDEDHHPYLTRHQRQSPAMDGPASRGSLLDFVCAIMKLEVLLDPLSDAENKLDNAPPIVLNDATAAVWLDALVADTGLAWGVDPSRTLMIATPKRLELLAAPYGVLREPCIIEMD
ncbi:MAG: hypothetical protein AAF750_15090, partial [Planctomycetota bacterium]